MLVHSLNNSTVDFSNNKGPGLDGQVSQTPIKKRRVTQLSNAAQSQSQAKGMNVSTAERSNSRSEIVKITTNKSLKLNKNMISASRGGLSMSSSS